MAKAMASPLVSFAEKGATSTVAEDVCCRETAQWRPDLSYLFNWELESQDVPGSKIITSKSAGFDWTTLVDSLNMSQIILKMWLWHCLNKTNKNDDVQHLPFVTKDAKDGSFSKVLLCAGLSMVWTQLKALPWLSSGRHSLPEALARALVKAG